MRYMADWVAPETRGASFGPTGAITTVANEPIQVPSAVLGAHRSIINRHLFKP